MKLEIGLVTRLTLYLNRRRESNGLTRLFEPNAGCSRLLFSRCLIRYARMTGREKEDAPRGASELNV